MHVVFLYHFHLRAKQVIFLLWNFSLNMLAAAAVYSPLQSKAPEMKVLYSYDERKPCAEVVLQHLGDPQLSDQKVIVHEGNRAPVIFIRNKCSIR